MTILLLLLSCVLARVFAYMARVLLAVVGAPLWVGAPWGSSGVSWPQTQCQGFGYVAANWKRQVRFVRCGKSDGLDESIFVNCKYQEVSKALKVSVAEKVRLMCCSVRLIVSEMSALWRDLNRTPLQHPKFGRDLLPRNRHQRDELELFDSRSETTRVK